MEVLSSSGLCPEDAVLRRWWASGDTEPCGRVLMEAERDDADIIGPIARDESHPLHEAAIRGLEFGLRNRSGRTARSPPCHTRRRTSGRLQPRCWSGMSQAGPRNRRTARPRRHEGRGRRDPDAQLLLVQVHRPPTTRRIPRHRRRPGRGCPTGLRLGPRPVPPVADWTNWRRGGLDAAVDAAGVGSACLQPARTASDPQPRTARQHTRQPPPPLDQLLVAYADPDGPWRGGWEHCATTTGH